MDERRINEASSNFEVVFTHEGEKPATTALVSVWRPKRFKDRAKERSVMASGAVPARI